MSAEKLKYQSNDNYPWEYGEETTEIWMADFKVDQAKSTVRQENNPSAPVILKEKSAEENFVNELDEGKIEDLFTKSLEIHEQNLAVIKARGQFSWILATIVLLIIVVAGEIALNDLAERFFWSVNILWLATWLWRLFLLIIWLWFSQKKWKLKAAKVYAATISAFVLGVVVLAIWKIVVIGAVWTWLNLLIEPIWMVLLIALVASLFTKFILPDKYGRYQGNNN